MKLFKITIQVKPSTGAAVGNYSDWYNSDTKAEAIDAHNEDMHRYGITPADVTLATIQEHDANTLKPIGAVENFDASK